MVRLQELGDLGFDQGSVGGIGFQDEERTRAGNAGVTLGMVTGCCMGASQSFMQTREQPGGEFGVIVCIASGEGGFGKLQRERGVSSGGGRPAHQPVGDRELLRSADRQPVVTRRKCRGEQCPIVFGVARRVQEILRLVERGNGNGFVYGGIHARDVSSAMPRAWDGGQGYREFRTTKFAHGRRSFEGE